MDRLTSNHTNTNRSAALALALLVPAPTAAVVLGMIVWPGTVGSIIFAALKVWLIGLPLLWLLRVDRQRLSFSPARRGGFAVATTLGFGIAAIIFGAYFLGQWLAQRYPAFAEVWIDPARVRAMAAETGLNDARLYLAGAAYWIVVNSLLEEYVWRWFVFRKCEQLAPAAGGWLAVLLSALFFTLHHIVATSVQLGAFVAVIASIGELVGGAAWSWCYLRYRSIWPSYVSHAIVDVPVFVIGWWLIFGS